MIQSLKLRLQIFKEKLYSLIRNIFLLYRIPLYVSTCLTLSLILCLHSVVQGDCPILSFFFFFLLLKHFPVRVQLPTLLHDQTSVLA
jgi:hypothetical protein